MASLSSSQQDRLWEIAREQDSGGRVDSCSGGFAKVLQLYQLGLIDKDDVRIALLGKDEANA